SSRNGVAFPVGGNGKPMAQRGGRGHVGAGEVPAQGRCVGGRVRGRREARKRSRGGGRGGVGSGGGRISERGSFCQDVSPAVITERLGPAQRIGLGQVVVVGIVGVAGDAAEGVDLGDDIAAVIVCVRRGVAEPIRDRFNGICLIKTELNRIA